MSEHFVKREEPPPGISSFTKIRLGWIQAEEVVVVQPGENWVAFLSPLARKGNPLVVKIPLRDGQYYLLENRQPIGYDRTLPDFGLLILKVNPDAREGYGTVQAMKANPKAHHFSQATYRLDQGHRNLYLDRQNNIAILPLWKEGEHLGVLVTTPEKAPEALQAALAVQDLLARYSEPGERAKNPMIPESLSYFKRYDFPKALESAKKGMK
jgi:hypothetical protein